MEILQKRRITKATDHIYFKPRSGRGQPISIDRDKIYRAKNGEFIRIYSIENEEIHGAIKHHGKWEIDTWGIDGTYLKGGPKGHERDFDLTQDLRLTPGKRYKSRDGRPIDVYQVNHKSVDFPVIGAIKDEHGHWLPRVWNNKGLTKVPFGPNNDIIAEWSEG